MNKTFFLGGLDLEMVEIKMRLKAAGATIQDRGLSWGAKASAYSAEIAACLEAGATPVLVELEIDVPLSPTVMVIDHHGNASANPASLLQVLALLGVGPDRRALLVAANDTGGYFGLLSFEASEAEIAQILSEERAVQGFTSEMEAASQKAVSEAQYSSNLVVIRLPFSRFAAAKTTLWLKGHKNMVFIAEDGSGEVEFQGDGYGAKSIAKKFNANHPWSGGAGLGQSGRPDAYVGMYISTADQLIEFVKNELK